MDKLMIGEFRYDKSRNHYEDNDIIDRLNGRYTVLPLMMAFLAVTYAVVVGGQISCWMPCKNRLSSNLLILNKFQINFRANKSVT